MTLRDKEVAEMAKKKVMECDKDGKSKMIASCGCLERRWSDFGRQCGNTWSRLENKSEKAWSERKSVKEEVQSQVFAYQKE